MAPRGPVIINGTRGGLASEQADREPGLGVLHLLVILVALGVLHHPASGHGVRTAKGHACVTASVRGTHRQEDGRGPPHPHHANRDHMLERHSNELSTCGDGPFPSRPRLRAWRTPRAHVAGTPHHQTALQEGPACTTPAHSRLTAWRWNGRSQRWPRCQSCWSAPFSCPRLPHRPRQQLQGSINDAAAVRLLLLLLPARPSHSGRASRLRLPAATAKHPGPCGVRVADLGLGLTEQARVVSADGALVVCVWVHGMVCASSCSWWPPPFKQCQW